MVSCCFVSIVSYSWVVSYFCCLFSYHSLLELHYGEKHEKSLTAKDWANAEGLSVRDTECHMDMDMFLDGFTGWEVGSPHNPIILHKMFQYTMEQGWKEVEWMFCWGHWHGLLKLDPKAGISTVWLVGPQTSKEEFRALYYEVYKLRRLPGSPPWELEWMEEMATEIVSSLKDHLGWKEVNHYEGWRNLVWLTSSLLGAKTPRMGRKDTSAERDLAEARKAHQTAQATAATLEEEIEQLSWSVTQARPEVHAHSWSWDCCRRRS